MFFSILFDREFDAEQEYRYTTKGFCNPLGDETFRFQWNQNLKSSQNFEAQLLFTWEFLEGNLAASEVLHCAHLILKPNIESIGSSHQNLSEKNNFINFGA